MRHFAITGIDTAAMISRIFFGEAMRATPPSARICAGTRSRAMTDTAPAFSAISACLASVTSMMTPPLSISARPVLRRRLVEFPLFWDMGELFSDEREGALGSGSILQRGKGIHHDGHKVPRRKSKTFTTDGTHWPSFAALAQGQAWGAEQHERK